MHVNDDEVINPGQLLPIAVVSYTRKKCFKNSTPLSSVETPVSMTTASSMETPSVTVTTQGSIQNPDPTPDPRPKTPPQPVLSRQTSMDTEVDSQSQSLVIDVSSEGSQPEPTDTAVRITKVEPANDRSVTYVPPVSNNTLETALVIEDDPSTNSTGG